MTVWVWETIPPDSTTNGGGRLCEECTSEGILLAPIKVTRLLEVEAMIQG